MASLSTCFATAPLVHQSSSQKLRARPFKRPAQWASPSNTRPTTMTASPSDDHQAPSEASQDDHLAKDIFEYLQSPTVPDNGPLSFVSLQKVGRTDLMSAIMRNGGSQAVASRLNLDPSLFLPPLQPSPSKAFPAFNSPESGASLSVGRDLEARLSTIDDVVSNPHSSTDVFPVTQSPRRSQPRSVDDDYATQAEAAAAAPVIVDKVVPPGESLAMPTTMRIGLFLPIALSAMGFGRASVGTLDPQLIHLCQSILPGLLTAHVALALYTAIIYAPSMRRDPTVWFVKILLSGPLGIRQLRAMGPLTEQ